ncbi:MAG: sensor histidine kinase [Sediminispirochaetaceae bacterium]
MWSAWRDVYESSGGLLEARFQISAIRYAFLAYIESAKEAEELVEVNRDAFIDRLLRTRRINGFMNSYLKELLDIRLNESGKIHAVQLERVSAIRLVSFLGIGGIVLLMLFFGTIFSESISRPIRTLADHSSRMAEGELNVEEIRLSYRDEIGVLTRSFNRMRRKINSMIQSLEDKVEIEKQLREDELKIAEMNRSLQEAQFLSLQSQISPHFLFNTLNTISRTSLFEKAPETVRLIEALSKVLRYTLNEQNKVVPMSEEVKILEDYMHIQQSRYGERLGYRTEFSVPLDEVKLPIFTLQPLVENAIKYGIEPAEEGGEIFISAHEDNGAPVSKAAPDHEKNIIIRIEDTGIGIDDETLRRLSGERTPSVSGSSSGIGISNVRRRLNLVYGGGETLKIEHRPGGGTVISITIPGSGQCIEY